MEQHVKERLIGAAVLVAIAVILIPELLSGRGERPVRVPIESSTSADDIKTYTFDLANGSSRAGKLTRAPTPPPEDVLLVPEAGAVASSEQAAEAPAQSAAGAATDAERSTDAVATTTTQPAEPQPAPVPVAAAVPSSAPKAATTSSSASGWAVQLGSFAEKARALRLQERLQAAGHNAYIVPLQRKHGSTLHRVRIGPYERRAAAESALQEVSNEVKGAAIVRQ